MSDSPTMPMSSRPSPRSSQRARWLWQPDQWIRLATVLSLVGDARGILDVGGRGRQLQALTRTPVLSLNVEAPADLVIDRDDHLPFPDRAFDAVTSCDVLEHISPELRWRHLAELVRVADDRLVLCFPYRSEESVESERRILSLVQDRYGARMPFLEEHVSLGLPETLEVADRLARLDPSGQVRVFYSRGRAEWDQALVDAIRARYGRDPRAAVRAARLWLAPRRPAALHDAPGADAHRSYVVLSRGAGTDPR